MPTYEPLLEAMAELCDHSESSCSGFAELIHSSPDPDMYPLPDEDHLLVQVKMEEGPKSTPKAKLDHGQKDDSKLWGVTDGVPIFEVPDQCDEHPEQLPTHRPAPPACPPPMHLMRSPQKGKTKKKSMKKKCNTITKMKRMLLVANFFEKFSNQDQIACSQNSKLRS